jgi:hypothetical protein
MILLELIGNAEVVIGMKMSTAEESGQEGCDNESNQFKIGDKQIACSRPLGKGFQLKFTKILSIFFTKNQPVNKCYKFWPGKETPW